MKKSITSVLLITAVMFTTSVSCLTFTGCERKPKTLGDKVDDALDARPNEKLKDAGEDIKDAVKDATNDVKK